MRLIHLRSANFVIALVAMMVLASCGGDPSSPGETGSPQSEPEETGSPASEPAATEPGDDGEATELRVSVGYLLFGPGESLVPLYMQQERLFEDAAAELGYDLTVSYQAFPTGGPMVQAVASGQIDFAVMGATPLMSLIAQNQAVAPVTVSSGNLEFMLVVREGSEIRNLEDLEGKSVALVPGTDLQAFLDSVVSLEYGVTAEEYVNFVQIQTPAQAAQVPEGADAGITVSTAYLPARDQLGTQMLVNSYGETGPYYEGEHGSGEGNAIPAAEESPFWPEGYMAHRGYWVVRDPVLEEHPDVVTAWAVAQARAVEWYAEANPVEISSMNAVWELTPEQGAEVIENDLLRLRGWPWMTQAEAAIVHSVAQRQLAAGVLDEEVTWDQIQEMFGKAAGPLQRAYEIMGSSPDEEVFLDESDDLRGLPIWRTDEWADESPLAQ